MFSSGICTAGIVMIGDEILKGQIIDTNSNFLTKRLHALGVKVCKMVVVADDIDDIAEEIKRFSHKYNVVITSGGIGPTHDDVTYSGIAKAFGENVILNSEMAHLLQRFYPGQSCTDIKANPALKLAMIPKSGNLLYVDAMNHSSSVGLGFSSTNAFPIVQVNNVYILPGIPEYFEYNFIHLEKFLKKTTNCVFHTRQIYVNLNEVDIVSILNCAVEKYKNEVIFGSYPSLSSKCYKTKLTIESTSKEHAEDSEEFLRKRFPSESIVDWSLAECVMDTIIGTAQLMSQGKCSLAIKAALNILEECCNKYSPSQIFLSFNGGKDCTVLIHMASAVFKKKFPGNKTKLKAVYIRSQDPFPELEVFIEDSVKRYDLDLTTVPGPIKSALGTVLKEDLDLKAVLMGTRRTDPYAETLLNFQMTDKGWPQVMRVNPLLDWDYDDIWMYLRELDIPYCSLYDQGYTSLGGRSNTSPNPELSYTASNGTKTYHPAHTLKDATAERAGRH